NRQSGSSPPVRSRKVVKAAEALIASGLPLLALNPKAKDPLGRHAPHGFKSATTDVTVAESWFVTSPHANLGIAPPVGVLVLDVYPRHGGTDTLASLTTKHGPLPETVTAITGAKKAGQHYYFACPTDLGIANKSPAPGLDIKGHGEGYLVAPPSVHPEGGSYQWTESRAPGESRMAPAPSGCSTSSRPREPRRTGTIEMRARSGSHGSGRTAPRPDSNDTTPRAWSAITQSPASRKRSR